MKPSKTATPSRSTEKRNLPKRSNSSVGRSSTSGMGLRSVSTGMLCQAVTFNRVFCSKSDINPGFLYLQSDSEPEPNQNGGQRGGLMRQTISSQNKQNGKLNLLVFDMNASNNRSFNTVTQKYINPRSAAGIISRRKGLQNSYSSGKNSHFSFDTIRTLTNTFSVNLSTTAQDGSSSEESSPPNNRIDTTPTNKPLVPPRPRNISVDHKRTVITLTASKKDTPENTDAPCKDSDLECDSKSRDSMTFRSLLTRSFLLFSDISNMFKPHKSINANDKLCDPVTPTTKDIG